MVCIGDFWAASEGLDDLIIRIGRMITYQEYNTKSPLNGLAAKWAAQTHLLPIDPRPIAPPFKHPAFAQTLQGDEVSGVVHSVSDGPAQGADPWSGKCDRFGELMGAKRLKSLHYFLFVRDASKLLYSGTAHTWEVFRSIREIPGLLR